MAPSNLRVRIGGVSLFCEGGPGTAQTPGHLNISRHFGPSCDIPDAHRL
jgi:hypothetical protein